MSTGLLVLATLGLDAQVVQASEILQEYPRRVLECDEATPRVAVANGSLLAESADGSVSDLGAASDAAPGSGRVLFARGRSLHWYDCASGQSVVAFDLEHPSHRIDLDETGAIWILGPTDDLGSRPLTRIDPAGKARSTTLNRPVWSDWERSRISEWVVERQTIDVDVDVEVLAVPSGAVVLYLRREVLIHCTEDLACETIRWRSPRGDVCAKYLAKRTEPPCPSLTVASGDVQDGKLWLLAYLTGVADDENLTIARRDRVLSIDFRSGKTLEAIELPAEFRLFLEGADELTLLNTDGAVLKPLSDVERDGARP